MSESWSFAFPDWAGDDFGGRRGRT